jgi:signal recognition particle subunit SRP54
MADLMKSMGRQGMLKQAMRMFMGKGGLPDPSKMSAEQLAEAAKGMREGLGSMPPGGMPGMPRGFTLPAGLSGMMKKK